jgi:hypothetical protein
VPFLSQVAIRRVGVNRWQLLEDLCYRDDRGPVPGRVFTTPAGYTTDFASRPWLLGWLVSRVGATDEPAITHDLGCDALREQWEALQRNRTRAAAGLPPLPVRETWLDAVGVDALWHRALVDVGVGPIRAAHLWMGVRWGAAASPWRRARWWTTAPAVLALTAADLTLLYAAVKLAAAILP